MQVLGAAKFRRQLPSLPWIMIELSGLFALRLGEMRMDVYGEDGGQPNNGKLYIPRYHELGGALKKSLVEKVGLF